MSMDQVPPAAMEAAKTAAEGVEFTAVAMDDDEGTETYELSGTTADGMNIEIDLLADGTLEEVEKQIDAGALPEAVTVTLEQELPGFAPAMVEESTRADGSIVYEFEGTHDGKEIDAEVSADGSNYVMNDDTAG